MKRYRGLLLALAAAVGLVLGLRLFCGALLVVPQDGAQPVLRAGDRVWVSRWSYGLRLPGERWWGCVRWGESPVPVGSWVAFNNPAQTDESCIGCRDVFVGYCFAAPGDTLWLNSRGDACCRRRVRGGCVWPVVVPGRGTLVSVKPWNASIYARTINAHEPMKAAVIDGRLCVDGLFVDTYRFSDDYYWMTSGNRHNRHDSRVFGFVPSTHLIGGLCRVLYSVDGECPWHHKLRPDRFFLRVAPGCACSARP